MGRFLQTDPIGYADGLNMYAYVGGDPVNGRDPSGLRICDHTTPNCKDEVVTTGQQTGGCSKWATCTYGPILNFGSPAFDFSGIGGDAFFIGDGDVGPTQTEEDCTDVQRAASAQLRANHQTSMDQDAEVAGIIYSNAAGNIFSTPGVTGPRCPLSGGCGGPPIALSTAQLPAGATIRGYWHTHGGIVSGRGNAVFSAQDRIIGEPRHNNNPFRGRDLSQYEGNFIINPGVNGQVKQYFPETIPPGPNGNDTKSPSPADIARSPKVIKC